MIGPFSDSSYWLANASWQLLAV